MVKKANIPSDSLLNNSFDTVDYEDSFNHVVRPQHEVTSNDLIRIFLCSTPVWVVTLMKIRDHIAKVLRLKTHSGSKAEHEKALKKANYSIGEKFGLFELLNKNEKEAILGTDDSHLNFRVSLYLDKPVNGNSHLYISTIVKINNRIGWIYFNTIDVFHKLVVKSFVKRMAKNINSSF